MSQPFFEWHGSDLVLRVRIQPRASRDEVAGIHGNRLKIRITAPPVDGKANEHLVRFLAKLFGVPRSAVTLTAGTTSRDKSLRIVAPGCLPPDIERPRAMKR